MISEVNEEVKENNENNPRKSLRSFSINLSIRIKIRNVHRDTGYKICEESTKRIVYLIHKSLEQIWNSIRRDEMCFFANMKNIVKYHKKTLEEMSDGYVQILRMLQQFFKILWHGVLLALNYIWQVFTFPPHVFKVKTAAYIEVMDKDAETCMNSVCNAKPYVFKLCFSPLLGWNDGGTYCCEFGCPHHLQFLVFQISRYQSTLLLRMEHRWKNISEHTHRAK